MFCFFDLELQLHSQLQSILQLYLFKFQIISSFPFLKYLIESHL